MNKRIFASVSAVMCIAMMCSGCIKKDDKKNFETKKEYKVNSDKATVDNKKSVITVYLPQGVELDKKYYNDKDVAINYLPNNIEKFSEREVDDIVNNIDRYVKLLVISTDKPGLDGVFKKVKDKLPGTVTVAANMQEMNSYNAYEILSNPDINNAFVTEKYLKGVTSVKMAKLMGVKSFVYLYTKSYPNVDEDIKKSSAYAQSINMTFKAVEINTGVGMNDNIKKVVEDNVKAISEIAIYPSNPELSKDVLDLCLKYKFIIPNLNSGKDGKILAEKLDLTKEYDSMDREAFDEAVVNKLNKLGLSRKIAGITEGELGIPAELSIEISKYMYEKNLKLEESYRDDSLIDRGNRKLNLMIEPQNKHQANSYFRTLVVYPRIY